MNAEVVRLGVGVWMTCDDPMVSVSSAIAIEAMQALGLDPNDWRQRGRVIAAISERVNATLDGIAKIESVDQRYGDVFEILKRLLEARHGGVLPLPSDVNVDITQGMSSEDFIRKGRDE